MWLKELKERKQNEEKRVKNLEKQLDDLKKFLTHAFTKQSNKLEEIVNDLSKQDAINSLVKWSMVILIIVVFVIAIHLYNAKIAINMLQEEINTISVNASAQIDSDAATTFINSVLPRQDDKWYDKNSNKFYYDPDCKFAITNPTFCSYYSIYGEDSKGNKIKVYRLTNGNFAYIPSNFSVYFEKVD